MGGVGGIGGVGGVGGVGGGPDCQPPGDQTVRVDLLLAIDNSRSMADKQAILALTMPDLVQAFVNPRCVDADGVAAAQQPANPTEPCPSADTTREFAPVTDLHIGIVSSSLGSHGADTCQGGADEDDHGHLLTRLEGGGTAATYEGLGFLAWDPSCGKNPPGETHPAALVDRVEQMVVGVGQVGCGFESQLESWFRFLVDPNPYDTLAVVGGQATKQGVDSALLQQRADFLRPDSLLAVVMFTDENDCSIREYSQYFLAAQAAGNFHLPRARQECATDPDDPCCKSCAQDQGFCPPDPTCDDPILTTLDDNINVRCFDQKRRFGIDFLYPVERYVNALSLTDIAPGDDTLLGGVTVPNPIFSDLDPTDDITAIRGPEMVFLAGIVGVPWQDLARDPTNLSQGYKSAAELLQPDASGDTGWDLVLGDPQSQVAPLDPLMVESIDPRTGVNPPTGDALETSANPLGNAINGHEYSNPARGDLQFSCIFPIVAPKSCANPEVCDCSDPDNDSPLCEPDPANANLPTLQARGKAYPGVRQLSVLKGLAEQGVTTSICANQVHTPGGADYGYRPNVRAIIDAVKPRLAR